MSQVSSGAAQPADTVPHRGIITVWAMVATLMQALGASMPAVSLPYMQGTLAATADQIACVAIVYAGAAVIMAAPMGWAGQRFGLKKSLVVFIAGFTLASIMCGFVDSLVPLVFFRLLQGAFGGGMAVLSWVAIRTIYPPVTRNKATAVWGAVLVVGLLSGPLFGALLTEFYSWRWIFIINTPLGILAITGLLYGMAGYRSDAKQTFGWTELGAIALVLGVLEFPLANVSRVLS